MRQSLEVMHALPEHFLDVSPQDIGLVLEGPTLILLEGKEKQPLFVSTLLHGNETSGFTALQTLLKEYRSQELPRSLAIFICNIDAAKEQLRRLDDQLDFNRVWNGGDSWEHKVADALKKEVEQLAPFAAVDIHNNTGESPIYGCINNHDRVTRALAQLFSKKIIFFTEPKEVLAIAMGKYCPAITLECGLPGSPKGIERVCAYLDKLLHLEKLEPSFESESELGVYQAYARIFVPEDCKLGFGDDNSDINIVPNIDLHNFSYLRAGFVIGRQNNKSVKLKVLNQESEDISDQFIEYKEQDICIKQEVFATMFTKNAKIAIQDCLGYFMKAVKLKDI